MKRILTIICAIAFSGVALSAQNNADTIRVNRNGADTLVIIVKEKQSVDRQARKEQRLAEKAQKPGFFKQAFRDMKESAKRQREIDKANFKAQKMETKAFYQEQKAKRNPEVRKMVQEQEYQKQMAEAKARQEAAQKRIDEAKNNQ